MRQLLAKYRDAGPNRQREAATEAFLAKSWLLIVSSGGGQAAFPPESFQFEFELRSLNFFCPPPLSFISFHTFRLLCFAK